MEKIKINEEDIPLEIRNNLNTENTKTVPQLSEVMPKQEIAFPELEEIGKDELLNVPIIIEEVKFFQSTFDAEKEFVVAKIMVNEKWKKIVNGSKVIVEKLKKIEDKLPVGCKIVRKTSAENRKYYDIE